MNLTMNADRIENFWDGLMFFGIGAAAGASGYLSGGLIGGVGFINGALSGMVSSGVSTGLTGVLNGNFSWKSTLTSMAISGAIGGVTSGITSKAYGGKFFTGKGAAIITGHRADATTGQTGESIEYSNESAEDFSKKNFPGYRKKIDELHADNTVPKGYTAIDGLAYDDNGIAYNGFCRYEINTKRISMYLYENAFGSYNSLYSTMGHEYTHVNLYRAGFAITTNCGNEIYSHDVTAYTWSQQYNNVSRGVSNLGIHDNILYFAKQGGTYLGSIYFPSYPANNFLGLKPTLITTTIR